MAGKGISGIGVTVAAAGAYLMYAGVYDVPVLAGLRNLAGGSLPQGRPPIRTNPQIGAAVGSAMGGGIVAGADALGSVEQSARRYLGIPYKWGGHDPSTGFDCSGLVTWVLHHDVGIDLEKYTAVGRKLSNVHTVTAQFMVGTLAETIPRADARSGDLVCWAGHIGIVVGSGPDQMINAPHPGAVVREDRVWGSPIYRRLKG